MNSVLVIAGVSAVGKTTVAELLLAGDGKFELVRSVTTRAPRGDGHDSEYIYITDSELDALIERGEILEYTQYASSRYGTPRSEIDRIISSGKTPLLILDIAGVKALNSLDIPELGICAVYIYDDIKTVDKRLYQRYLGAEPSVEGLKKYISRKEQNIADYRESEKCPEAFYAFIENRTPQICAENIISALGNFASGIPADISENARAARALAVSLEE